MKKGQMKIQQMAFMLLVVTLFFVLVGLFFTSIALNKLKHSKDDLEKENAALTATNLAKSPEFSCGASFGTTKLNCVDFEKAFILSKRGNYQDFWGVEGIEIRKIYPKESNKVCNEETFPYCELLVIKEPEELGNDKSTFVSLCHKEPYEGGNYNKCEIARLIVRFK
jgi:hypothetical protein